MTSAIPFQSVEVTAAASLAGVVVGWALQQWTGRRNRQRDERKPIGRALMHLLDIHWFLFIYEAFRVSGTAAESKMASDLFRKLGFGISAAMPTRDDADAAYAKAVDSLAEVAPTLAWELHGKLQIRSALAQLSKTAGGNDGPERDLAKVLGDFAITRVLPTYEKLILDVAKEFSRRERRRIRDHFMVLRERLKSAPEIMKQQLRANPRSASNPQ